MMEQQQEPHYRQQQQQQQQHVLDTSTSTQPTSNVTTTQLPAHYYNNMEEEYPIAEEYANLAIDARPILPNASFFMGDLRDGLPMVRNIISTYHTVIDQCLDHHQKVRTTIYTKQSI